MNYAQVMAEGPEAYHHLIGGKCVISGGNR